MKFRVHRGPASSAEHPCWSWLCAQPLMMFQPGKVAAASRLAWERGVALVVVGFPATPLMTARARICISAAHTRADLDYALKVCAPCTLSLFLRVRSWASPPVQLYLFASKSLL